jgi:hypothetical protein
MKPVSTYTLPMPHVYSPNMDALRAGWWLSYRRDQWFNPRVYTGGYTPRTCWSLLVIGSDQLALGYVIGERWVDL